MRYYSPDDLKNVEQLIKQTNVNRWSAWVVGIMLSIIHTFINVIYLSQYYVSNPYLVFFAIFIIGFICAYLVYYTLFWRVEKSNKLLFINTVVSQYSTIMFFRNNPNSLYREMNIETYFPWLLFLFGVTAYTDPKEILKLKDGAVFNYIPYVLHSEYLFLVFVIGFWIFGTLQVIFLFINWLDSLRRSDS